MTMTTTLEPPKLKWQVLECINEACAAYGGRWPVEANEDRTMCLCPSCNMAGIPILRGKEKS
jgi:hypothetical protein